MSKEELRKLAKWYGDAADDVSKTTIAGQKVDFVKVSEGLGLHKDSYNYMSNLHKGQETKAKQFLSKRLSSVEKSSTTPRAKEAQRFTKISKNLRSALAHYN